MEKNAWIGESSGSFMTGFVAFCVKGVPVCFTPEAEKKVCLSLCLTFISALLFLLSSLLVVCQRCQYGGEYPVFYSFLGNLCSTVGAILSQQLYIQVLKSSFTAAVDALSCILHIMQVFLCWNSQTGVRLWMMRQRRRQHLVAVSLFLVVAGSFLKLIHAPVFRPIGGRRLLNVSSGTPITDYTEILGYILGLLALLISCTSRLPPLCRVYRGHRLTNTHVLSGMLGLLAEAIYIAALLHYNTGLKFLLRVMPWFLSSAGCVIIELLILFIHWFTRGNEQQLSAETESLLGESGVMKGDGNHKTSSLAQMKTKPIHKITEMGRYMDISFRPSKKNNLKIRPLNPMVQMIHRNCPTDTSFDSSEVSSDLEWDFEVTQAHWKKTKQEENEFLLQEWITNPQPFTVCTCSSSGHGSKTHSGTGENGPASSLNK
ncbi:transmembrane protein 44 [Gouania willdenowi]|uniref:Transmembrane protein 44 n=1 Tax=Gouania willdenowi TaxID=441366 RepID=A0A8C5GQM7_GOUWI|nr:transmembrane protein 44 [Gouania willdenowi]